VHENRLHAELRRVNARDLEMHMKSKAQLFACLSLEGKSFGLWPSPPGLCSLTL